MKRITLFLLGLLLAVLFVACQAADSSTKEPSPPVPDSTSGVTSVTSTAKETTEATTEADTTYEEIFYDTTPITGEVGTPYLLNWNPYLLSPAIPTEYEGAFHEAIRAILNRRLTVTFSTREELLAVKDNLFYEFPPSALSDLTADENTLTLHFAYYYDRAEHLAKLAAFKETVEERISRCLQSGDDEAEKAILLYHEISHTIDYIKIDYQPRQTNAYYALMNNLAICYSFSDAYNYLLRQVGVEAWLVKGHRATDKAPHGWSLIKVNGSYYHCDTTWESSFCDGVGFYYFAMNDKRRQSAIALSEATIGDGILKTSLTLSANGTQFETMSGDKYHTNTWTIDRDRRVLYYNGKEYSYDNT